MSVFLVSYDSFNNNLGCKTSCPTGNYMQGTCSGEDTTDTITCEGKVDCVLFKELVKLIVRATI